MEERIIKINGLKIGKGHKYVFSEISGLSDGNIIRTKHDYVGIDGLEYTDPFFEERELKISGTIIADSYAEAEQLKRKLTHACNGKGAIDLCYKNEFGKKFYADAITDGLPIYSKRIGTNSKCAITFVVNLIISGFYWQSRQIETVAYEVIPELNKDSVLPCRFSSRLHNSSVNNCGDVATQPKIQLHCNKPNEDKIVVQNETSGEAIMLDYTMTEGETILIDCEDRRITSTIEGDITACADSIRNFFSLNIGENLIKANTTNVETRVFHRNKYVCV